ncbi:unnamed protein product [Rotaria magnacalcarata]|uniref:Uncharacterized protein n=1 Tax=Rotaria magnacalcarata TaxID=392030 RepID=A0A816CRD1_9BILA|nr:unnamed protein product [Rotaria magnacalcarata]CAF2041643.1 unnamed protein product [Rotaria magnacalcarata]CAF3837406.1 unnamed protein product [Rotaria magnacalcarata]CAF3973951.1 unnamed protein product [Rotaria magnacalcarata]CAF4447918.1 unnamed protein product [Rotaria magnacalcarata]
MLVNPVHPDPIVVPMIRTGCMKHEFDSSYSIRLNGIISQDEYRQSMENINRAARVNVSSIILTLITCLCVITGIALFIVGGLTANTLRRSEFPVFVAIALALGGFGVVVGCIGFTIVRNSRERQMRRVIANESMKYSRRSQVPCTWRLNIIRMWRRGRGGGNGSKHVVYQLSQNNAIHLNQLAPQAASYFPQQHNIYLPLNSSSNAAFCSQCGAPTQDPTANFFRSCGNVLNKY